MDRRSFLKTASGIILGATPMFASDKYDILLAEFIAEKPKSHPLVHKDRTIELINTHTEESLSIQYMKNGKYDHDEIKKFSYFMRDFRTGDMIMVDPKLLNILYALKVELDTDKPFYVLSGYRSKKTNEYLRKKTRGVAKNSLHTRGKAIDITLPNKSVKHIAKTARSLKLGGVGQYNRSNFVHLDTGRVRHWYG